MGPHSAINSCPPPLLALRALTYSSLFQYLIDPIPLVTFMSQEGSPSCLSSLEYVERTNAIGWQPDDVFLYELRKRGYRFSRTQQESGRIFCFPKYYRRIVRALAIVILEQLPFNVLYPTHPELPIELWEYIIDWIEADRGHDQEVQETLSTCSVVCQAWSIRARMHLFTSVYLKQQTLFTFERLLKRIRQFESVIREINIYFDFPPQGLLSALFISHRLHNLNSLFINWLDLTREHVYLSRALLPHAVKHLGLFNLPKCKLSQLVHFLNPFHSLTSFELGFDANDADCLEYSGQILPPPCTAYSRTLTSLELELIPGVSKFLDWCLKAETFLSYLEELILLCRNKDDSKFRASLEGVGLLLSRCSRSVGELTLKLWNVPMVNEISDIFYLQSLSKLHKLTYVGRNDANIFKYVSRQICAISSPNSIAEVTISFELTYQRDKSAPELCRSIDKALSNLDTFPSLRRVEVDNSDLLEDFPCLHKRGILLGQ